MAPSGRSRPRRMSPRGFTLLELIITLLLGTIILGAAITFLITHIRSLEGSDIREEVSRNDRYIGALLRRDLQLTGVDIKSTTSFGTIAAWPGSVGDTLIVLYVPYEPEPAPAHEVDPGVFPEPPPGEGTCGDHCLDVLYDDSQPLELQVGDLARLEVEGVRRLIIVEDIVTKSSTQLEVTFTDADTLLRQPAGLVGNLRIAIPGTYIQKLVPIIFYLDDQSRLMRAQRLHMDGSPDGDVVAYGVERFDLSLIFADGDELPQPDPYDSDSSNDYDDIVGVKARVTVKAHRVDPRVNEGRLLRKSSEWRISPRNLRYEKNRV